MKCQCDGSGIIDRGPREEREICVCMDDPEPFKFHWLGSESHFDADGDYEGGFRVDYCCEEGHYTLQIEDGLTVLIDHLGEEVVYPCENLEKMVALFDNAADPRNPATVHKHGLVVTTDGAYYALGDRHVAHGMHKPMLGESDQTRKLK